MLHRKIQFMKLEEVNSKRPSGGVDGAPHKRFQGTLGRAISSKYKTDLEDR